MFASLGSPHASTETQPQLACDLAQCVCVSAQSLQSCLTLCDPMDYSLPGSSVHEILQSRLWSGLPCSPPGDLPDPGIEPVSPALQAYSLPLSHCGSPSHQIAIIVFKLSNRSEPSFPAPPPKYSTNLSSDVIT